MPTYDERLVAPPRWWVFAVGFALSVWWAFILATPATLAWAAALGTLALLIGFISSYGAARVAVRDGVLTAGRARIPVELCGSAEALDADASRDAAGPRADARAYLLLRPYIATAVRVPIDDPRDPTPYWLVSSRHPDRLAAALREAGTRMRD